MGVKYVIKNSSPAAEYTGQHAGIGVDSDNNRLFFNPNGTARAVATEQVGIVTASTTATAGDSGKVYIADSTTSVVITLPTAASVPGGEYTLVVRQLTSSGGHAFSPNAADSIEGNGLTSVANKDIICSAATDREGDSITLRSDGVNSWIVTAVTGTWAKEA